MILLSTPHHLLFNKSSNLMFLFPYQNVQEAQHKPTFLVKEFPKETQEIRKPRAPTSWSFQPLSIPNTSSQFLPSLVIPGTVLTNLTFPYLICNKSIDKRQHLNHKRNKPFPTRDYSYSQHAAAIFICVAWPPSFHGFLFEEWGSLSFEGVHGVEVRNHVQIAFLWWFCWNYCVMQIKFQET